MPSPDKSRYRTSARDTPRGDSSYPRLHPPVSRSLVVRLRRACGERNPRAGRDPHLSGFRVNQDL